jgi:hypothetical protein
MQEDGRKMFLLIGDFLDKEEFVENGVPIMVAVYEGRFACPYTGKDVQAELLMKSDRISIPAFPFIDIVFRSGIDHMKAASGFQAVFSKVSRIVSLARADFDD